MPEAAYVLPVQSAHEPAAVAVFPVNLEVEPSLCIPHDVQAAQLLVPSDACPDVQSAHEPACVVEALVNLEVEPSSCIPHDVWA